MTKQTIRFTALALLLSSMTLSGCNAVTEIISGPTASGTNTQTPAATIEPTDSQPAPTATPTPTPSPTATSTPTSTPSPTPTDSPTPSAAPITDASASATDSAAPTASADPTPTPAPTPPLGDRSDVKVVQYYDTQLPQGLSVNLLYSKYEAPFDYFVLLKGSTVRELPNTKAKALLKVSYGKRLPLLAQVKGSDGKSDWYRVKIDEKTVGYLPASVGSPRSFQLQKALDLALTMKAEAESGKTLFVNNYRNARGTAPKQPNGKSVDALGYRRDQAAPAYPAADGTGEMRYLPDGTMLQELEQVGEYVKVKVVFSGEELYVPVKYVNLKKDHISALTQVVSVDRKNQNVIVMQYGNGSWQVVSLSYVSTGKTGGSSLPTPLGAYVTLGKAPKFFYYGDSVGTTKMFAGFAPYAVRFSCGAWLHGVPHDVEPKANFNDIPMPKTYREAITSLGTTPQSHMCVRNYTSHAQFLYNWLKIGSSAVTVIE